MKKLFLLSLCPLLMMLFSCHNQHGSNKTIKLGVRTIDEKGNDLPNFKANCYISGTTTVLFDTVRTPVIKGVNKTHSLTIIHVQGVKFSEEKKLDSINRDTTIVFVIKRCN